MSARTTISRRDFLSRGALMVSFALTSRALARVGAPHEDGPEPRTLAPNLPGDLKSTPWLDAWIRIEAQGRITVFTGKAELGQGIRTALLQVAAEELDVPPTQVELVTADTFRTPDEGGTDGSHTMQDSGTAIRNAAANARLLLTRTAAKAWKVETETITTTGDGRLRSSTGRVTTYGEIATSLSLHVEAVPNAPLREPKQFRTMGTAMPRVDVPAKLTGGAAYVHDIRLPGMLHARVVRGPCVGTALDPLKIPAAEHLPGVFKIVQAGSFVAVVAEREWAAIIAQRRIQGTDFRPLPSAVPASDAVADLKKLTPRDIVVLDTHGPTEPAVRTVRAQYSRPWLSHGSIGPSCAVALLQEGVMTIWTHSQSVFNLQYAVAELLRMPPEKVRAIHAEGAGCYGHNGADDVAADAALIARTLPGHPIRLQWMREQEFGWEPFGPGMLTEVEASLDAQNRIVLWNYEIWSNSHNGRPVSAGGFVVGQEAIPPFPVQVSKPIPMPAGDGDRNANPLYALPNMHVIYHFLKDMPTRVSALRSLGAHLNVFSIESMFDELAKAAGVDPLALRLAHMQDGRARGVMQAAAERFDWSQRIRGDGRRGCGMGFARYKNQGAYCAVMLEIELKRESGRIGVRRAVSAVDGGQPVNPDGIRNQVEGGIIQSLSWTIREMATFDATHRTTFDWSSYPILRFLDMPDSVEVHVVNSLGLPFLGVGECAQGPTAAALANALADVTGVRLRDMPLSPARVKAAIGA
jgi:nicotinate dehydrogenase subunit B